MTGVIYKYKSPSGKVYIGQTINESRRRKEFQNPNNSYGGIKIDAARKKYGVENFEYEVLATITADDDVIHKMLTDTEAFYIKKYDSYKNGYNNTPGGDLTCGISIESRKNKANLSKKYYKNYKNPMKGVKLSDEKKLAISRGQKEYYKTHNSPFIHHHLIDDAKRKISEFAKTRVGIKTHFMESPTHKKPVIK